MLIIHFHSVGDLQNNSGHSLYIFPLLVQLATLVKGKLVDNVMLVVV